VTPMQTPEDVKARVAFAYNHAADFYDHPANGFWGRAGRRTIERLRPAPRSRILDVCCGSGASALPAAEAIGEEGRVLAVDLAQELTRLGQAKASRLGLRNVEFRIADLLTLEPEQGRFDAVVCVFGLFFVPDMNVALRHLGSLVQPAGRLAVTTWGREVFEPVNSMFWDAVRVARPELYKAFNPWDRISEPEAVAQLFVEAGLPEPEAVLEPGSHPLHGDGDVLALLMGTGYRGVLEQLSAPERDQVAETVLAQVRANHVATVKADVIYAIGDGPQA
jgi:ubiquinone/menaquinone biosynthesis C-methylase UbiE